MAAIANPLKALSRYRTGKGFGVHSPFAFNFILKVLREKWGYYDYAIIDEECSKHEDGIKEKYARLTFRIINHFNPDSIALIGNGCEIAETCAKCVSQKTEIFRNEFPDGTQFVITGDTNGTAEGLSYGILTKAIENNAVIIFQDIPKNETLWEYVTRSMSYGMSFSNRHFGVAVCRNGLPLKHYRVWL